MTLESLARRVAALAQLRCADPGAPALSAADDHHLRRVLRARVGEEVVVADGAGAWTICAVSADGLEPLTPVARDPAPAPTALYLAMVRGPRGEWAVAKAAEVGLARVVPLLAARAQVPHAQVARLVARWRAAAAEAAGQCRRTHDLEVADPVAPGDAPAGVAVADPGGDADWAGVTEVAVGPEGGWAPGEWDEWRRRVSLGPTVLRAETAAVVAGALVALSCGGWGFRLSPRVGKDEASR